MVMQKVALLERYRVEVEPYLTIMDSVGTSIEEVDDYAKLNKPDVMFCDQLDKFRISGQYNRGDERLKETYVTAREIAKRNQLLIWAVSQASYDAHDRQFIDYSMLDNSRTGKAGKFVSDKLGYKEIQMHRSLKKQALDGLEAGGALAMSLYMIYPMMDALFQVLFDSDELRWRRAGINHVFEVGGHVFRGEKGMDSLRQVLMTINPALQLSFELMMNTNLYSGQNIVDYNDLLGDGDIGQFGSDLLDKGKTSIPQISNLMRAEDENEEASLRKWTTGQIDLKTDYGKGLGTKSRDK